MMRVHFSLSGKFLRCGMFAKQTKLSTKQKMDAVVRERSLNNCEKQIKNNAKSFFVVHSRKLKVLFS